MMIKNQKQKEIKMKKITSIITISLIAIGTTLCEQSSTNRLGNTYYHSDGSSTNLLGNTYYNSDGSSTNRLGNTYYNSSKKRTSTYILDDCYPCK